MNDSDSLIPNPLTIPQRKREQYQYRAYLTRRMPVLLHKRLKTLALHMPSRSNKTLWSVEETLNACLAEGLKVWEARVGITLGEKK